MWSSIASMHAAMWCVLVLLGVFPEFSSAQVAQCNAEETWLLEDETSALQVKSEKSLVEVENAAHLPNRGRAKVQGFCCLSQPHAKRGRPRRKWQRRGRSPRRWSCPKKTCPSKFCHRHNLDKLSKLVGFKFPPSWGVCLYKPTTTFTTTTITTTTTTTDDEMNRITTDDEMNPCEGKKPKDPYFNNVNCTTEAGVLEALEQSGTNVTLGYRGDINTSDPFRAPVTTALAKAGLCPVNVHWHYGAEHLSVGEFDEHGTGPENSSVDEQNAVRQGFQCHHYNKDDPKFTMEYEWQYCDASMKVGETYEVHWPHSQAGECDTKWQYQTPFLDGVFCKGGIISLDPLNTYLTVGVQAQVYTIVNDENFYYPNLFKGMRVEGDFGADMTYYTGSTTGTSVSNEICSRYTPITWQVDRKCHLISASSFDKMCKEMKKQADDMKKDLKAHGARELVMKKFTADDQEFDLA